jgi:hypothetical protein
MSTMHRGSCHCGAVRFECELDLSQGSSRCNCTFCHKARFWMTLVKTDALRVTQGADLLTDYRHTPPNLPEPFLHLYFCSRCGVRPFSRGGLLPQLGSEFYAVNIACLDDLSDEVLAQIPVRYVDGRRGRWDLQPAEHRHM